MKEKDIAHPVVPNSDDTTCVACHRKFQKGDWLTVAYQFSHASVDPLNFSRTGINLERDYRFAHVNCADPKLWMGNKG